MRTTIPARMARRAMLLDVLSAYCLVVSASPIRRSANTTFPWLDATSSSGDRANLLIANLTLEEKFSLVDGGVALDGLGIGGVLNPCIGSLVVPNRTGLPGLCMGDGPEGVSNGIANVTTFPAPLYVASSFDEDLAFRYGLNTAREQTAKGRNVILAPTINILRTPLWGRNAESLSEDPYLAGRLGVGLVKGIQNLSAIACPKHFAAYNQEINRFGDGPIWNATNVIVSNRTLEEIYYPAFRTVVQEAKPGAVMTSYNQVNGHYASENVKILSDLRSWGFENGFTVSDWYFGIRSTVPSVIAGLDISMPGGDLAGFGFPDFYGAPQLTAAIDAGEISVEHINRMAYHVLEPMFRLGLVDSPIKGNVLANVRTPAAHDFAAEVVEKGSVLLKNTGILPLNSNVSKIALIGHPGNSSQDVTELHGGFVLDANLSAVLVTPVQGIMARAQQSGINVTYSPTSPQTERYPSVPSSVFTTVNGTEGLTATYWQNSDWSGSPLIEVTDNNITNGNYPAVVNITYPNFFSAKWRGYLTVPENGTYLWSVFGGGLASVRINGTEVMHIRKSDFTIVEHGAIELLAGERYDFAIDYSGAPSLSSSSYGLSLGWVLPSTANDLLDEAKSQASAADVAIVFVSDAYTEGSDRNTLSLTAGQNELISAIAAVNSRTVVVINDNGPVLMPWLGEVDAVVYGGYGGEAVGTALARLLWGDVNFSGKLAQTFPPADRVGPGHEEREYPGVNGDNIGDAFPVYYDEGLLVGYRWYDAKNVKPLFPFGFGLSYTDFKLSNTSVVQTDGSQNYTISATLANEGQRPGSEVVQLYVNYPESAGEPPKVLKGFKKVELDSSASKQINFEVSASDLQYFDEGSNAWKTATGTYTFLIGNSSAAVEVAGTITL